MNEEYRTDGIELPPARPPVLYNVHRQGLGVFYTHPDVEIAGIKITGLEWIR